MQLQLTANGLDLGITQQKLQFRNGHVGGADVPDKAFFNQIFKLPPCFHVGRVDVGLRVRIA